MASLVHVLMPRFWENVQVDIFARAACEHTCVCICVHMCGPCPACECTCVQNGVGVRSAGPAPALPSARRPRGEGGTQPLQGLTAQDSIRALSDPPAHTGAGGGSQSGPGRPGPLGNLYEPRADGPTEAALSCWPWSALETPLSGQPGGRGPRHTGVGLKASAAGRGSGCSAPGPCWHKCWAERGLAARQTAAPAEDDPTFLGLRVP